MKVEERILKAKEDTKKIFDLMSSCFDKEINTLHEWVVVSALISDVLKIDRKNVDEDMIRAFINEFNSKIGD